MFRKGVKLFTLTNALLVIGAIMHTMGLYTTPVDKEAELLQVSMQNYQVDMGMDMAPSVFDIYQSWGIALTLLMIFVVMLNLTFVRTKEYQLLKEISLINTLFFMGLAFIFYYYRLPLPLISLSIITTLFAIATFQIHQAAKK